MSCFTEVHTCSSYENDFICSQGYCFEGQIDPNAGIPGGIKASVNEKNIEIDGVYQITRDVAFVDCNFKMHPGSSIRVAPVSAGVVRVRFIRCKFFGCGDMWYGITVDASSTDGLDFYFRDCTLEDAAVGLTLDENRENWYTITGNEFFNNHLGITNMQKNDLVLNAAILGNKFYSTDTLAAATMTLQGLMPYYPRAFAGVELIRISASIGGASGYSHLNIENEFYCMYQGLREVASSVGSGESYFHDLDSAIGSGISAAGGSMYVDGNRFESAGSTALNAEGANLEVFNSEFGGRSSIGVNSTGNLNGEQVDIMENNSFDINDTAWTRGIWLTRSQASGTVAHNRILDNQFEVGEEVKGLSAIVVVDQVVATDELHIRNNTITANQVDSTGMDGISLYINNSNNFKVSNNTIQYSNPGPGSGFGIFLSSSGMVSDGHSVTGNTITGESNDALQCCIHTIRAYNVDFCENEIDHSQWGLHFNNTNYVSLRENRINRHEKGIVIGSPSGSAASISSQSGRGNTWSALTLDPDDCTEHCIYMNTASNPLFSQINVIESDEMPFLPPENKIFPNSTSIPPSIWVDYDPNEPADYCDPEEDEQPPLIVTPFERGIILDTSALTGAELWDARRNVYTKLLHNPALRPSSSDEETFYNGLTGTVIDSFAQVEQLVMDALEMSAGDQHILDSCRQAINLALSTLALLDTLVNTVNTDTLPYTYFSDRADLLETATEHKVSEDALEEDRYNQIETGLQAAFDLNAAIATTETWEAARQTFNELYIRRLLREPLTDTFYTRILGLAGEDPAEAGVAASDATILLAPCDVDAFREPEGESEEKPVSAPMRPQFETPMRIIPNPSTGFTQVVVPAGFTGIVTILDSRGQKIAATSALKAGSSVSFQLERQPSGLYWVTMTDTNGKTIGSARFALIR